MVNLKLFDWVMTPHRLELMIALGLTLFARRVQGRYLATEYFRTMHRDVVPREFRLSIRHRSESWSV